MFKLIQVILVLLSFSVYGQESKIRPFKLVIITPDTAVIDKSISKYVDTIQNEHIKSYYVTLNQMRESLKSNDYPKELMSEKEFNELQVSTKSQLDSAIKYENKVKEFKYFQLISEYSNQVFQFYFNEYLPFSVFQNIDKTNVSEQNLARIADSLKADYVLGYKNIFTDFGNDQQIIKITTVLYSKNEGKIILNKETIGDTNSYGDMWTCSNSLECLIITAVKSSTNEVAKQLFSRQRK